VLSAAYCIGLGTPFILSGLYLDKSESMRKFLAVNGDRISKIGGIFLIVIGILQITGSWDYLMNSLRGLISGFEPVL